MKRLGQPFPGADKRSAYLGLFLRQSHPALGLVDRIGLTMHRRSGVLS
jgi:hypothetical protein